MKTIVDWNQMVENPASQPLFVYSYWLRYHVTGRAVLGQLVPLTTGYVNQAQTEWLPAFEDRQRDGHHDRDALSWDQGFLCDWLDLNGSDLFGYAVLVGGAVQGILVLCREAKPRRLNGDQGLMYVRYLATAPWNRKARDQQGQFAGVGRLLVAQSIRDSRVLGCAGRIGLHAFADALAFYQRLKFDRFGQDPACRGMEFYELSSDAAVDFMTRFELEQAALAADPVQALQTGTDRVA